MPIKAKERHPFSPKATFIARKVFVSNGRRYVQGMVFTAKHKAISVRRLAQLWNSRYIEVADEEMLKTAIPEDQAENMEISGEEVTAEETVTEEVSESEESKQIEEAVTEEISEPVASTFSIKHKGAGLYDVINDATGEKINDKPLKKSEAQELADENNT